MFNRLSGWLDTIQRIWVVAGMVTSIGVFLQQWGGVSTTSLVLILIAIFSFVMAGLFAFLSWREKRKFENIPNLLEKMDKMSIDYIDDFKIELNADEWRSLYTELGSYLKIDLGQFASALTKKDKDSSDKEFQRIAKAYDRHINPNKKAEQTLTDLLDMGSILDCYGIGVEKIKNTNDYKKLADKIKKLQRKVPSAAISSKINEFYNWSEGFYCLLLSFKPILEQPMMKEILPLKVKAKKSQVRPMIERQTSTLIAAVRESIEDYKTKRKEK